MSDLAIGLMIGFGLGVAFVGGSATAVTIWFHRRYCPHRKVQP